MVDTSREGNNCIIVHNYKQIKKNGLLRGTKSDTYVCYLKILFGEKMHVYLSGKCTQKKDRKGVEKSHWRSL